MICWICKSELPTNESALFSEEDIKFLLRFVDWDEIDREKFKIEICKQTIATCKSCYEKFKKVKDFSDEFDNDYIHDVLDFIVPTPQK